MLTTSLYLCIKILSFVKEMRQKSVSSFMLLKVCLVLAFLILCNSMFNRESNTCNNQLCGDVGDAHILQIKIFSLMEDITYYSNVKQIQLKKRSDSYLAHMSKQSNDKEYHKQSGISFKDAQQNFLNSQRKSKMFHDFLVMDIFQFSNTIVLCVLALISKSCHLTHFSQMKKLSPGILFWIFLSFINTVRLVGPIKYEPTVMNIGDSNYNTYHGISAVKGSGYCVFGVLHNSDGSYTSVISKFATDGTIVSTVTRGTYSASSMGIYFHSGIYSSGLCKNFYADATGGTDINLKFYGGVSSDTDFYKYTPSIMYIGKAIQLSDGTYVCVGSTNGVAHILRVSAANTEVAYGVGRTIWNIAV